MSHAPTVLITGASSGLGEEMARQLADRGYDLALCARRLDRLEMLQREIIGRHPQRRVLTRPLDVTDDAAVFEVFDGFAHELGVLDKVVVNAGLGKGARLGTGGHQANRQTAMTNFVGALTQTEAAVAVFRRQEHGHLVMVSSFAAVRGMPGTITTYAATKAGIAHLAEGLRVELAGTPIRVTTLYPGYIHSEMSSQAEQDTPLMVSTEKGVRAMVSAIERGASEAYVPPLPWGPLSHVVRHAPLPVLRRLL